MPMRYRECNYFKNGDNSQKPEKCSYWSRDTSLVVEKELEWHTDYTDLNVVNILLLLLFIYYDSTLL
jgi:hypothetical protein